MCCKRGPGKNNKFGCCGTETFFQDGEVGALLDGAEDAPSDGQGRDCGRVEGFPIIKDGLQSSRVWCVRPVEEQE